ncbi:unnamed protein product [Dovyalis caffra]|uniref:Exocyst complex component Sec10-like alpha-helical bundle domain-containing protein n=1 Tax=Dovyalis caffra TaxID=77055 RepID=A0AAV1SBR4_9ROSI|nr:unnamed protein product [Dovyalis caffra]
MANVFIVAPESLSTLFEGTPSIRKDAQRFIQLREDYKSAKLASRLSSFWTSSITSNWICLGGSETKLLSWWEINFNPIFSARLGQESGDGRYDSVTGFAFTAITIDEE